MFFRISWSIKCTICWKAKCHTLYGSHERTERKRKFNDYNSKQIETFLQVLLLPRDIWSLWVCLTFLSHLPVWISIFLWRHNREFVFWHPWRVVHPDCNQNWTIYKRNILFLIFWQFWHIWDLSRSTELKQSVVMTLERTCPSCIQSAKSMEPSLSLWMIRKIHLMIRCSLFKDLWKAKQKKG